MPQRYRAVAFGETDLSAQPPVMWRGRGGRESASPFAIAAVDRAGKLRCIVVAHPPSEAALDDGVTLEIGLVTPASSLTAPEDGPGDAPQDAHCARRFVLMRTARLARRRGVLRILTKDPEEALAAAGYRMEIGPAVPQRSVWRCDPVGRETGR